MSTTYTKKLKSIAITLVNGSTSEYSDTVDEPIASNILYSLQHEGGAYIQDENAYGWFPTSAVLNIAIIEEDSDPITKSDPYCIESSSDVYLIKLCQDGTGVEIYCDDSPLKPERLSELFPIMQECAGDLDCVNAILRVEYNGTILSATMDGDNVIWTDGTRSYKENDGTMNFVTGK